MPQSLYEKFPRIFFARSRRKLYGQRRWNVTGFSVVDAQIHARRKQSESLAGRG